MDEKKFDYAKFESDLKKVMKEKQVGMTRLSVDVCLRSPSYLGKAIKDKKLPANVVFAVAKWADMDLKGYEIKKPVVKKEPKVEKPAVEEVKTVEANNDSNAGWSCIVKVDEDFGMAMMKIFKDGKEIALGRSYTYGHDDAGIVQGISYAAHMCYKIVQQTKMANESIRVEDVPESNEAGIIEDDEMIGSGVGRVVFKDWIKKYEKDNSKAGKLARFIGSHYQNMPSTGKKKIRSYIRLNKGESHLTTFDSMWQMYYKWYNLQYDAGNVRIGVAG